MVTIKNPLSGGGGGGSADVVNGIIEQYKAESGTIDANTFVEFVYNWSGFGNKNHEDLDTSAIARASAALIDENKVFLAYYDTDSYYPYGVVVVVDGSNIEIKQATQLSTAKVNSTTNSGISVVNIDTDKAFVAFGASASSGKLQGIVCTISDTTITAGTTTALVSNSYTSSTYAMCKVTTGKVFIVHNYGSNSGSSTQSGNPRWLLYGVTCSVSDMAITTGADTRFSTTEYRATGISTDTGSSTSTLVASALSGGNVKGTVGYACTISNLAITVGAETTLTSSTSAKQNMKSCVRNLETGKYFVAYSAYSGTSPATYDFYGAICGVSNTTITANTDTALIKGTLTNDSKMDIVAMDTDEVIMVWEKGSSGDMTLQVASCAISGTTVSMGASGSISAHSSSYSFRMGSLLKLSPDRIFMTDGFTVEDQSTSTCTYGLEAAILSQINPITVATASTNINGLTKTACTAETAGDVWVLDTT